MGDPEELLALDEIFCTGRKGPLLIGTVKSNLGHSEAASGVCSVAKVNHYPSTIIFRNDLYNYTSHRFRCVSLMTRDIYHLI